MKARGAVNPDQEPGLKAKGEQNVWEDSALFGRFQTSGANYAMCYSATDAEERDRP